MAVSGDLSGMDSWDDVAGWLRSRRVLANSPTYRDLAKRIGVLRAARGEPEARPGRVTVYDCFRDGRRRMDLALLGDLAAALDVRGEEHRQFVAACFAVATRQDAARVVGAGPAPPPVASFTGREDLRRELSAGSVRRRLLTGMPGSGKTQLALAVARELIDSGAADRAILADLRGFHSTQPPAAPEAMCEELLRILGERRLRGPDALAARLASERCVLILDDAVGPDQVQGILGSGADSWVLITSRLLFAVPGVESTEVPALSRAEAITLFAALSGRTDTAEAGQLIDLVGSLPLAISLTASRVADAQGWTLGDHLAALGRQSELLRLPEQLSTTLELSYRRLPPAEQAVLRLLAGQPCPSLDLSAVAALTDRDPDQTVRSLRRLCDAHLVRESEGRYGLHDLIRTYAAGRSIEEDPPSQRTAARHRLDEQLVRATWAAVSAAHLHPCLAPIPAAQGAAVLAPMAATAWLAANLETLLTITDPDLPDHRPEVAVALSMALYRFLGEGDQLRDGRILHGRALAASQQLRDPIAEARARVALAESLAPGGEVAVAEEHLRVALDLVGDAEPDVRAAALNISATMAFRAGDLEAALEGYQRAAATLGEPGARRSPTAYLSNRAAVSFTACRVPEAIEQWQRIEQLAQQAGDCRTRMLTLINRVAAHGSIGEYDAALDCAERASVLAEDIMTTGTLPSLLVNRGELLVRMNRPAEAEQYLRRAVQLTREYGDRHKEAAARNRLGAALLAVDRPEEARTEHELAGALAAKVANSYELAQHHHGLGMVARALDDERTAVTELRTALDLYESVGTPETAEVRAALGESA